MRVLKEGSIPEAKDWKAITQCSKKDEFDQNGCGAELEIIEQDLILMYFEGSHFNHYFQRSGVRCAGSIIG